MPECPRETLGTIFHNKEFQVNIVSFIIFCIIFVLSIASDYWVESFDLRPWLGNGLMVASYMGTISLGAFGLSWILVDQTSWLARAIIYLTSGLLFIVCGFQFILVSHNFTLTGDGNNNGENVTTSSVGDNGRIWKQIMLCLNMFQGVYLIIVSLCLCIVLDAATVM